MPKFETIKAFNAAQNTEDGRICKTLQQEIDRGLPKAESIGTCSNGRLRR